MGLHHHWHQFSLKIILYFILADCCYYLLQDSIIQFANLTLGVRVPHINEVLIFNQNEERRVSKCFGTNVSVINPFTVSTSIQFFKVR